MFKEKETVKIKYWSAFLGRHIEDEAVVMTAEEFQTIKNQKETPDWVYISDNGMVLFNEHTCLSSYRFGGNCACLNHPHKKWVEYGELLNK
jgi:hypothetical protein